MLIGLADAIAITRTSDDCEYIPEPPRGRCSKYFKVDLQNFILSKQNKMSKWNNILWFHICL